MKQKKTPNDQRSDTLNPNNPAFIDAAKNRSRQLEMRSRNQAQQEALKENTEDIIFDCEFYSGMFDNG